MISVWTSGDSWETRERNGAAAHGTGEGRVTVSIFLLCQNTHDTERIILTISKCAFHSMRHVHFVV